MPSPTFSQVREALATAVGNTAGIKAVREHEADSITITPCAEIRPAPGDFLVYSEAFGDIAGYLFYVTIYIAGDSVAAQKTLDDLLAATGVRQAVNGTLGGLVADAEISTARNYRGEQIDEARYVVCDLPVKVMC